MLRPSLRADALVFTLAVLGAGWFHQGGGWNQNSRFAMVRAIVESGTFTIDDYLVYEHDSASSEQLRRVPVTSGNLERKDADVALAWRGNTGALMPVDPQAAGARKLVAVDDVAATGDIAYFAGHVHPNKAPGTSFAAVPGYAIVRGAEALFGVDPDRWSVLTVNAWLTSLLSVGLATALAAVLVLRLARTQGSELSARLAALAFAFATMAWPLGTMLFEHNIIAAVLLAGLYLIETAGDAPAASAAASRVTARVAAAGFFVGYAAITNYTMALLVPVFAAYLFVRRRSIPEIAWFGAGVAVPLAIISAYNIACFGTPLTTNYAYESKTFLEEHRFLGVFALPRVDVLGALLFSPYRGLFYSSPVLLAAVAALVFQMQDAAGRAMAVLVAVVMGFLLLVNASFNGWDGGWTAVPRYLAPGIGLLAIPLARAFDQWRSLTWGLASISFVMQLLMTAVDPQPPVGDVAMAGLGVAAVYRDDPMTRYDLPIFLSGHPWPLIDEAIERSIKRSEQKSVQRGEPAGEIARKSEQIRGDLHARIERGDPAPFELAGVTGPVSANPIGIYEGYYYRLFPAGSTEARGNSFNLGEYVFPDSRLSLLPLFVLAGGLVALLFQSDDEDDPHRPGTKATAKATATPVAPTVPRNERRRRRR